jgi:hypothetical protein
VLVEGSQVWSEPRAISVLSSKNVEWGMLITCITFKERPGILDLRVRSISFQDTRARSIRKACSQKCFREGAFDIVEWWSFDRGPTADAGNEAVIAEILIENSRGVFGGQFGQDNIT